MTSLACRCRRAAARVSLPQQGQVNGVTHGALATITRVQAVTTIVVRQHLRRTRGIAQRRIKERRRHYTVDRLISRIEHLGYRVQLEPVTAPAA